MSITALRVLTPPNERPLSLTEAKEHLRVTYNAEDAYIDSLIDAAVSWAQTYTHRILIDTVVEMRFDRFPQAGDAPELYGDPRGSWFYVRRNPGRKLQARRRNRAIVMPGGKVTAVQRVEYLDDDAVLQTLTGPTSNPVGTDYREDLTDDQNAHVYPPRNLGSDTRWPSVEPQAVNAAGVIYNVGWPSASDVPSEIIHAIRFKVADMFTMRDSVDGKGVRPLPTAENLLEPYVIPEF